MDVFTFVLICHILKAWQCQGKTPEREVHCILRKNSPCLYQVNPINNKRLLNMKSRTWGTPDGSAFHPVANETSPLLERPTQRAISADGVPIPSPYQTRPCSQGSTALLRVASLRGREATRKRAFRQEGRKSSLPPCAAAGERGRDEVLNAATEAAKGRT